MSTQLNTDEEQMKEILSLTVFGPPTDDGCAGWSELDKKFEREDDLDVEEGKSVIGWRIITSPAKLQPKHFGGRFFSKELAWKVFEELKKKMKFVWIDQECMLTRDPNVIENYLRLN